MFYVNPHDVFALGEEQIAKVHLKDFKRKENGYEWVTLSDGDVDWEAVRRSFAKLSTQGSAICELNGGDDPHHVRDVSAASNPWFLGKPRGQEKIVP